MKYELLGNCDFVVIDCELIGNCELIYSSIYIAEKITQMMDESMPDTVLTELDMLMSKDSYDDMMSR